jgi:predicted DNA-binding transcriptional regulator AlpA
MKKQVTLIVTLTTSDLRNLISEVLEEKLFRLSSESKETQKDVSLISRLDVAKLFGVSKTTIDKWRRWKILPPSIKMSSRIFFNREQIIDVVKRQQKNPNDFLIT